MWWEGQDFGIGSRIRKVARDCLPSSSAGQLAIRNQQSLERKIKVWTNCSNVQMRGALKKEEILNKGGVGWVRTPNHPKCVIKNLFVFFTFFGEKWHFVVVTNLGRFPKKVFLVLTEVFLLLVNLCKANQVNVQNWNVYRRCDLIIDWSRDQPACWLSDQCQGVESIQGGGASVIIRELSRERRNIRGEHLLLSKNYLRIFPIILSWEGKRGKGCKRFFVWKSWIKPLLDDCCSTSSRVNRKLLIASHDKSQLTFDNLLF